MRQRLSWTQKKADPYTMNQQHANNPVEKYKTYDTSTGKEDPDMQHRWEAEGRTETGHPAPAGEQNVAAPDAGPAPMAPAAPAPVPAAAAPAPAPEASPVTARDAVLAARKLEDKALKCITIAQRMLPGADDGLIELQATDLMYMPERCILATLQRQAELAQKLVTADEPTPAAPAPMAPAAPAPEKKDDKKPEDKKPEDKKPEDKPVEAAVAPVAPAAPAPGAPAPEKKPEDKKPEDGPMAKTASDGDLLDILFANDEPKQGAKKLSGIVKQASTATADLDTLWDAPPDVSKAFR